MEIRFAQKNDVDDLKRLWKVCFQDEDTYIDFFFAHQYKEEATIVLCFNQEVVAMLTMIPTELVLAHGERLPSTMLYAIATDPVHQGAGFSTQLITYAKAHAWNDQGGQTLLVPGEESLFDFYEKRGYQVGFDVREFTLTQSEINEFAKKSTAQCVMAVATAKGYNQRRDALLKGQLYLAYKEEEMGYQKKLCKLSGADLYHIDLGDIQGCAAVERISPEKIMIKEILLPEDLVMEGLIQIATRLPGEEYMVRLPASTQAPVASKVRAFAMIHFPEEISVKIAPDCLGYLGFAYD